MCNTRWRLFRLFGIPISVDVSWLFILMLLSWTLKNGFHATASNLDEATCWLMGFATALAFFACIVLHEMGHALVARAKGIPIRGINLFLFGGVAEMTEEPASAWSEFLMAIAGPLVSVVLAVCFWSLSYVGDAVDWPVAAVVFCYYLALINTTVLIFNLVPAFPLDGGRVLRSVLWGWTHNLRRATFWAAHAGRGFGFFLMFLAVLNLMGGAVVQGLWLGLIGLFLHNAAQASYQQVVIRQLLQGEPVGRFMNPAPIVVPEQLDLEHWVEDYVYRYHHKSFPVSSNSHLAGVVSTQALSRFPRSEWETHTVAEVMDADLNEFSISPKTDALEALTRMQRTGLSKLLVTEGSRLVGILSLKDLLAFLNLKMELESTTKE